MITSYFYEGQLRSYLLQFCNIFAGLQVQMGYDECNEAKFVTVPISVGSKDRIVAAIMAGNTQNKPFAIPAMAAHMSAIEMADQRKGIGYVDRRTVLKPQGVFPDDLQTIVRVMPIPYVMGVELSIYASNTHQLHQILEQLLVLFDPILQIQTSNNELDWTKITSVKLVSISNEENYPVGQERRIISWTLGFEIPIYISPPFDVKQNVVKKIIVQYSDSDFVINEYDENGNPQPFIEEPFTRQVITGN